LRGSTRNAIIGLRRFFGRTPKKPPDKSDSGIYTNSKKIGIELQIKLTCHPPNFCRCLLRYRPFIYWRQAFPTCAGLADISIPFGRPVRKTKTTIKPNR
jgi:hypothetical protein